MDMTKKGFRVFAVAFFVLLSYLSVAFAQQNAEFDYTHALDTYARFIPSRSAWDQPGSVKITESEFEYDYQLKAFGKLPVEFSVNSQYIGIDNSTAVELPAHLTGFTAGLETTVPLFGLKQAYFHAGVFPSFYGENWAFGADHFRIPSKYYAIYVLNDQWTFVGGAAVFPEFDTTVSPVLGVIYKPNDKLTFHFVTDTQRISYALTDKLTLFVEGHESTDNEFIVTRGAAKKVTLEYNEGHLGTGIKFKINKYTDITLSGGQIIFNSLKYLDGNGKVVVKNGPYVELRVQVKI